MNKNNQTYSYNALVLLGMHFFITDLGSISSWDFDVLLGLAAMIQLGLALGSLGIFMFQHVAFMKKEGEIAFYKKRFPKLQGISYLMALLFYTVVSSLNMVTLIMVLSLILINIILMVYFVSERLLSLLSIEKRPIVEAYTLLLAVFFIILTVYFHLLTIVLFFILLLSKIAWNIKTMSTYDFAE